jgi:hypothetical protein
VTQAPEISSVSFLTDKGFKNVATEFIPSGDLSPDFILYSAYEATNLEVDKKGAFECQIDELLTELKYLKAPPKIIIGEFGYGDLGPSPKKNANERLRLAVIEFQRLMSQKASPISMVFLWQGFPRPNDNQFGLFNRDGSEGMISAIKDLLTPSGKLPLILQK